MYRLSVFHIPSKMLCHLFHTLLDITNLTLQPIHIILVSKHDTLPLIWALIFDLENICISLQ
jgi:hypothetical protein